MSNSEVNLTEEQDSAHSSPPDQAQVAEVFDTEHHVYAVPFRYNNVAVNGWLARSDAGIELLADDGRITIIEQKPIVEVIVVGSGISLPNYNIVEWWGEDGQPEEIKAGKLIKRQKIDDLNGQHPNDYHRDILGPQPEYSSLEEAEQHSARLREQAWNLTRGLQVPGSLPGRFFENTARFRIGDTSQEDLRVYKVVVRGGGQDYGDPTGPVLRHHANYVFRLIDVVVRKDEPGRQNEAPAAAPDALPQQVNGRPVYSAPADDDRLGEVKTPEVFATQHHVYSVPFHYSNVAADGWAEHNAAGMEVLGEAGSITVREGKPIIAVTVAGQGCSSPNYVLAEWWDEGERELWQQTKRLPVPGKLIKRQRADNLKGQHCTYAMQVFFKDHVDPEASDPDKIEQIKNSHRALAAKLYDLSYGHHFPAVSIMNGIFEDTAYFRIGDTSRPDQTAHQVVIRGGAWDTEDPYEYRSRFPADYNPRLIDVEVRTDGPVRGFEPLAPENPTEGDNWTEEEHLQKIREVNSRVMLSFPEDWASIVRFAPKSNWELGEMRQPEQFSVEHRVYTVPFGYDNVQTEGVVKSDETGLHLLADAGQIVIEEDRPIIAVTVVGSGSVDENYVMVDWHCDPYEFAVHNPPEQLIMRTRVDSLNGRHASWLDEALAGPLPDLQSEDEMRVHLRKIQEEAAKMIGNFCDGPVAIGRLYENTAYFRIGDTSHADRTPYRVVITAGGLGGATNPASTAARYPGDYAIRLIDLAVRK